MAEDAYHRLIAVCYFPECQRDQLQALLIAKIEREEFQRVGADAYQPSEIARAVIHMAEKRSAQIFMVGLVAISYLWLSKSNYRPSLNRASIVASYSAGEINKVTWHSGLNPGGPPRVAPVTGDAATIERLFRKYRSVAHICGARTAAANYLTPQHVWDQVPEATGAMIQTAASFQVALESATDVSGWNLWDVKQYFPAELWHAPVLAPDYDLYYWVQKGYDLAIAEGKLVRQDGGTSSSPG